MPPLDPYFAEILGRASSTDLMTSPTAFAADRRRSLRELMSSAPKADVREVIDLTVPADSGPIPTRLYRPRRNSAPLTIYAHGGGWIAGDLDTHDAICRRLTVSSGNAILAVDYRRTPEHPYPAALDDVVSTIEWALASGDLDVDIDAGLALAGESSGANLVLGALLDARSGPHRRSMRALVLTHPPLQTRFDLPTHLRYGHGYGLTLEVLETLWSLYVPDAADRRRPTATPLSATSFRGLPRTLIQLAEMDPLRSEGEQLAMRMRESDVEVTATIYAGMPHGFQTALGSVAAADRSLDDAAEFLRR